MEFKKFIFGETLEKAIEAVPEEYQLKYYRIIKNYGLHGIEPDLTGFELATWVQMKTVIDNTLPKKNNASPLAKIGAPFGNKNAQKSIKNNSNNSNQLFLENNLNNENNENNSEENLPNDNDNDNDNVNENVNVNVNQSAYAPVENNSKDPQKLFLFIWQHTPDIFNALARIESPKEWDHFWKTGPPTCEQVKNAMRNLIADVREGHLEQKYVPLMPDRFVLKGWITRCQKRSFQKAVLETKFTHRIKSDNIAPEDVSKYFREDQ